MPEKKSPRRSTGRSTSGGTSRASGGRTRSCQRSLTDRLEKFRALLKKYNLNPRLPDTVGPGWVPLLDALIKRLIAMGWDRKVGQIKEKFGGLRFYVDGKLTDNMHGLILEYENRSVTICEECGKPGKLGSMGGWMQALCPTCRCRVKRSGV